MELRARHARLKRWQKVGLWSAVAALVYSVVGFLVLPPIVRSQAEQLLLEELGRPATIGEIRINPWLLSLEADAFDMPDRDGSPFVSFERLAVDFELSSIFHLAFAFREVRLDAPFFHVKILDDGDLNFSDIIERLLAEEPGEEPDDEDTGPPAVMIEHAQIDRGRIVFSDYSHPTVFEHEIAPLNVELRDFGTRPDDESPYSFAATTGAGESLEWEGNLSIVPLYSRGRFVLAGVKPRTGWLYFQDTVSFEVVDGTVDIESNYDLDGREGLRVALNEGEIRVRNFAVAERATGERVVEIGSADVLGIEMTYPEQRLEIEHIKTADGHYRMQRMVDGRMRVDTLADTPGSVAEGAAAASSPPELEPESEARVGDVDPAADVAPEWFVGIDRFTVGRYQLDFEDLSTEPAVAVALTSISLQLSDLTSDSSRPIPVEFGVQIGEAGRLDIAGQIEPGSQSAALDLKLQDLDLRMFEPYWASAVAVDLAAGRFGLDGSLEARAEPSAGHALLRFAGGARIDELKTLDHAQRKDLLSWTALELEGLELSVEPTSVRLDTLRLRDPKVDLVVAPDGTINVATLVIEDESGDVGDSGSESASPPSEAAPIEVIANKIELVNASIGFTDRSIDPTFRSGLQRLNGSIEGLSSDEKARARIDMKGVLAGRSPLRITGVATPLAPKPFADVKLSFEDFGLATFTPYSGRYIGQTIARGKLFVDVEYVLDGDELKGENLILLDQFTLGDKVASEDAVKLPVGLAIGLLKDRKGEINIDLPVSGRVDDPEFSVGKLIFGALGNLITKAALSPFGFIGGLAGVEGEDLEVVVFAPGSTVLAPSEIAKLEALATALAERPNLSLELRGTALREVDRAVMQHEAFELDLKRARFKELDGSWFADAPATVEDVVIPSEDRLRMLRKRYVAAFNEPVDDLRGRILAEQMQPGADPDGATVPVDLDAAITNRLVPLVAIGDAELRELARQRAAAIRGQLVERGGVGTDRVFVLAESLDVESEATAGEFGAETDAATVTADASASDAGDPANVAAAAEPSGVPTRLELTVH